MNDLASAIGETIVNVLTTRCIVALAFGRFRRATVQKLGGVDSQWSGRVSGRYHSGPLSRKLYLAVLISSTHIAPLEESVNMT